MLPAKLKLDQVQQLGKNRCPPTGNGIPSLGSIPSGKRNAGILDPRRVTGLTAGRTALDDVGETVSTSTVDPRVEETERRLLG